MAINNKGFTLVELLVTVTLVGILAAMSLLSFNEYKTKSYHMSAQQQVISARMALENYIIDDTATFYAVNIRANGTTSGNEILPGFTHQRGVIVKMSVTPAQVSHVDGGVRPSYQAESAHCQGPRGYSEEEGESLTSWILQNQGKPFEFPSSGIGPDSNGCNSF